MTTKKRSTDPFLDNSYNRFSSSVRGPDLPRAGTMREVRFVGPKRSTKRTDFGRYWIRVIERQMADAKALTSAAPKGWHPRVPPADWTVVKARWL